MLCLAAGYAMVVEWWGGTSRLILPPWLYALTAFVVLAWVWAIRVSARSGTPSARIGAGVFIACSVVALVIAIRSRKRR